MEAAQINAEDPKAILRRVGNVLIVVGIADIAWMIYVVSSGHGYSSSFKLCNALFVSDRTLDQFYAQEMRNSRAAPCVPMARERVEIDYQ